jgi:hypothetical protein
MRWQKTPMIDVSLSSLRAAQFAIAVELQARNWPNIAYFEVYPIGDERRCHTWLAMVDLDDGDEIRVTFETPFPVDAGDDRRWRRLNHLFWSGINIKSKTWSVPMPLDCRALTATRSMSGLTR